jgi:L-fucose mutarotase
MQVTSIRRELSMLRGIPEILSPELVKILCEMGHSDRIVLADGNFPAESMGKDCHVVRMDGHGVPEILEAILKVFPLDTYVEKPVSLMQVMPGDKVETPIWETYKRLVEENDERGEKAVGEIERFEFYEQAKKAYCIVATSEKALYANIMLQKGVL